MRSSRMAAVVAGSAAIVAVGYATAPKGLATLDLGTSTESQDDAAAGGADATDDAGGAASTDDAEDAGGAQGGASGTFDGPVVTNIRGDFQAQIVVQDGAVVEVNALAAGTSAPESQRINAEAIPELSARVLEAQDWEVDAYSGASYTSPGFLESVRGAFDEAGV